MEKFTKKKLLERKKLFNIPKEIYDSKTINLNKTVTDGKLKVDIKDLKIITYDDVFKKWWGYRWYR